MEKLEIPLKDFCIADATDGAPNMSSEYCGLQAKLREQNPSHIHTWCYSHVLNLVISHSCTSLASITFFNLLQSLHVFFAVSYKRMAIWEKAFEDYAGQGCMQRLTSLGETRWRAKHNAATKIFGTYDDTFDDNDSGSSTRLYHTLVVCLNKISNCSQFTGQHRSEAKALQDKLLDFEMILTAFIYLRIFKHTTPLSDYLQTAGLNYVQAWRMISTVQQNLTDNVHDFEHILQTANAFVTWANEQFENLEEEDCDHIVINPVLKEQPVRRRKRMPGENARDDPIVIPIKRFEVTAQRHHGQCHQPI